VIKLTCYCEKIFEIATMSKKVSILQRRVNFPQVG
jgi:hypothetical protein